MGGQTYIYGALAGVWGDCYNGGMKVGEIKVKVRFENVMDVELCTRGRLAKRKVRTAMVEAVVDTGAVMLLLPQELVEKLGLKIFDKTTVTLADESRIRLDIADGLMVEICGRKMICDCLVGPPGCEPLLGQLVMERLDLIPDPLNRTLSPRPESPFSPTLKLKTAVGAAG